MSIEDLWNGEASADTRERFRQATEKIDEALELSCRYCGAKLQSTTCVTCPVCGQTDCEE